MLIPATTKDFDFFYSLYMHPQVNPYLLYEMMDEQSFAPIYNDLLQQNVLYKYADDETEVGICKLLFLKHRNSHIVYLGGFAVHPAHGGKNYGYKMLQQIIAFVKERNILRIELSTSVENIKAITLYKKAGFMQEGIFKKYTHLKSENRFIDEVVMSYVFPNHQTGKHQ
jgi:RimJ/RimL family protein N-acetyltransferase